VGSRPAILHEPRQTLARGDINIGTIFASAVRRFGTPPTGNGMKMALDFHDQVSATGTATRKAARRARKRVHQTAADAARAVDLHEPTQSAKGIAKKAAQQAAKATGRASGRRSKRVAGRGLRVILVTVVAGGLLVFAFAAFRRMRATSSPTLTDPGFERLDAVGSLEDADPEARSETNTNGATPPATTSVATSTSPSKD
jgi:hypothetical protein